MIDSTIELVSRNLMRHPICAIRYLRRALSVAILLNDTAKAERVRDETISFEDRVAVDHFPGLWGFSFDMLLAQKRKVPLRDDQRQKLIADLEARLVRLASIEDVEKVDIPDIEGAALRLAEYYRREAIIEDVRRVMLVLANACIRKATESKNWSAAAGWLERVHELLIRFSLNDEAKALQPHYRQAAQALRDSMQPIEISLPLDPSALEEFISGFFNGGPDEILATIVGHFMPRREAAQRQLEGIMSGRVIAEFFSSALVDDTGRTISRVGPLGADPEGNLVHHMANMMDYGSFFLRSVIDRLVTTKRIQIDHILTYVNKSEIFDSDRQPVIESALNAYFSQNWLVAILLLVPQIEHIIRSFVGMTGGATVKKGRNEGLLLRNLDELLHDERIEHVYGADGAFYLRVLLTDQRGWNLRNDIAHGITQAAAFHSRTADRLFHALLVLGSIRRKPSGQGSTSPEDRPGNPQNPDN